MVTYRRLKTEKNSTFSSRSLVAVAYKRKSCKRFQINNLAVKLFGILENWSLRKGGHLQEVVATEGLTVAKRHLCAATDLYKPGLLLVWQS